MTFPSLLCLSIPLILSSTLAQSCGGDGGQSSTADLLAPDFDWEARRALTWNDYQSPLPSPQPTFDANGVTRPVEAYTVCSVDISDWQCTDTKIVAMVRAMMSPGQSWAISGARTAALLAHEQGHFDIAEVYARKLRAALAALRCESDATAVGAVDAALKSNNDALQAEEDQYDADTAHGSDATAQAKWQQTIAQELMTP